MRRRNYLSILGTVVAVPGMGAAGTEDSTGEESGGIDGDTPLQTGWTVQLQGVDDTHPGASPPPDVARIGTEYVVSVTAAPDAERTVAMLARFAGGDLTWKRVFDASERESVHTLTRAGSGLAYAGLTERSGTRTPVLATVGADGTEGWSTRLDVSGVPVDAVETSTGDLAVVGYADEQLYQEPWVVVTDADGAHRWTVTDLPAGASPRGLAATDDGGLAVVGHESGDTTDFWLARLAADGSRRWERTYDRNGAYDSASAVVRTGDGGFALSGYTEYDGAWLLSVGPEGDRRWDAALAAEGSSWSVADTLVRMGDGGFLVGESRTLTRGSDSRLVRVDAEGEIAWRAPLPSAYDVQGIDALAVDTDRVAVVGEHAGLIRLGVLTRETDGSDTRVVDDFEEEALDPYTSLTGSASNWRLQTDRVSDGTRALQYAGGGETELVSFEGLPRYPSKGDVFRFDVGTFGDCTSPTAFGFGHRREAGFHRRYELVVDPTADAVRLQFDDGRSDYTVAEAAVSLDRETFYTVEVDWAATGADLAVTVSNGVRTLASFGGAEPARAPTEGGVGVVANGTGDRWVYDDVRILPG